MSRSKSKRSTAANSNGDWRARQITFVPSAKDVGVLESYLAEKRMEGLDLVVMVVDEGHSIRFNYSDYYGQYVFSYTHNDESHPLHKHSILVYHSEYEKAILTMLYVIDVLLPNDDPRLLPGTKSQDVW